MNDADREAEDERILAGLRELDVMTERVMAAYALYRRQMHPNWETTPRWEKCWQATAKMLLETGWDPDTYMCVQFQKQSPFPQPNHLYNNAAKLNMLHALASGTQTAEIDTKISAEINFWNNRVNFFKDVTVALEQAAKNPSISTLFLFCAAWQSGYTGERWLGAAAKASLVTKVADAYRKRGILTPEIDEELTKWLSTHRKSN